MKKDILQIVAGTAVLCAVMDIVFFAVGRLDIAVLLGTLIGFTCAVLNFCFLALTVSKAVSKGKAAGGYMGISYLVRLFTIAAVIIFAIKSPYVNYVAVAVPLLFPRVIITLIQGIMKWKRNDDAEGGDNLGGA